MGTYISDYTKKIEDLPPMKQPSLCPGAREGGAIGLVPVTMLFGLLCAAGTRHVIQAFGIIFLRHVAAFELNVQLGATFIMLATVASIGHRGIIG